jgi:hypothetical protein
MFGYMGEDAPSDVLATAYDIWTGAYAQRLNENRDTALAMDKQVAALRAAWNGLPEGQSKAGIWAKYQQANGSVVNYKSSLNQAIGKYNAVADAVSKYTAGIASVPRVGMAEPITIGATTIIFAVVALYGTWTILQELRFIWQGVDAAKAASKGLIAQTADAITSVGGVVHEVGSTALKIAVAVGIVAVVYLGYRWLSGRKRGGSSVVSAPMKMLSAPAAPTLDLKTVEGKVVA